VLTEAHLLDFEGDLYGQRIELRFLRRIRDERRFSGPDELKEQIAKDASRVREILGADRT
jgi:riboflavin kinase/FMN adenylyltransferase